MEHETSWSDNEETLDQLTFSPTTLSVLGEKAIVTVNLKEPEPSILERVHDSHPNIEVRGYQVDCLDALARSREEEKSTALVHMATGLGKTTVAAADSMRYLDEHPESRILFLCHQKEILRQARQRFEMTATSPDYTFGEYHGDEKTTSPTTCLFASFQTMRTHKTTFRPDEFDYIIVDESHHGKAATYEPTLQYFQPQFLLGITATPNRNDLKDIRDIFGDEIYSKSLAEALAQSLLALPDYRVIIDDVDEKLAETSQSIAELNRSFFLPKRDEEIARIISEHLTEVDQPQTIVFCPSIEHSLRMQLLLDNAEVINSKMKSRERQDILDRFRNGETDTVITVDLFNEGIDIASANAIVFLRSTQSETIFLQQLGRGLRRTADKESVLVLDFVANCDRLMMIENLLHNIAAYHRRTAGNSRPDTPRPDDITDDLYDLDFETVTSDQAVLSELNLGSFRFTESIRMISEIIQRIKQKELDGSTLLPEQAITHYKKLSRALGRLAMIDDIIEDAESGGPGRSRLLSHFNNSLRELRDAAGYGFDAEHAVHYYKALSERLGHAATEEDIAAQVGGFDPGYYVLVKPFNRSLVALREAAGYKEEKYGRRVNWQDLTEAEAITLYQDASSELGHPATHSELSQLAKEGRYPSFIILGKFSNQSIEQLRMMAGLASEVRKDWSDMTRAEAIYYYKELSAQVGKAATVADINNQSQSNNGPSPQVLLRYFDGKNEELKAAAGFPTRHKPEDWPPERCVSYIQQLAEELSRTPTLDDVEARSKAKTGPNRNMLTRDFNSSFSALKKNAGLLPGTDDQN